MTSTPVSSSVRRSSAWTTVLAAATAAVAVAVGVVATVASIRSDDPGTQQVGAGTARPSAAAAGPIQTSNPPTDQELEHALETYRAAVASGLGQLQVDANSLRAAVHASDRGLAERRWLTAHLDYERLGAAYGTFGDLDGKINGRPSGLPEGVDDPSFTGFLRLERGLWNQESMAALAPVADQLLTDVRTLAGAFPNLPTPLGDIPLRAHEILENTLQRDLTGNSDEGSNSELATAKANVDGTNLVLTALTPVLAEHDPALLDRVQTELRTLGTLLDAQHHADGTWTPLSSLTITQRQRIDGATGDVLEHLANVALTLESQADRD